MHKSIFTLLVFFSFCFSITAQNPFPCGTQPYKSEWLKSFQSNPEAAKTVLDSTLYVTMTVHNVGSDDGSGYLSYNTILNALCILNEDFAPANIQFFLEEDVRYINNTAFNQHDSVLDGGLFMLQYDIENTINTYFVTDPAGNCGYNLPWASIGMNKGCSGAQSHTWAHEVGHNLSLPHPFYGWEGGVSWDNSVPHNFSNPAPRTVLNNYTSFKDSLILDTLIIDTILVELVERTNCLIAGDGFCDTYPDYISSRWNCNTDGESPTLQTDPDGVEFRSDGTLIMSYSDDRCANRFSEDQMAAMRASLLMEKPEVLRNEPSGLPVDPAFVFSPVFPQPGEVIIPENNTFQWDAVDNATHYLIQISRLPSFAVNEFEEIVNTNSAQIENLRSNTKFFWRVRPFNFTSTCANFSSLQNFETSEPTSIQTPSKIAEDLTVFPSPTPEGQQIFVKWTGIDLGQSNFEITDLIGRQVLTGNVDLTSKRVIQIKGSEGLHQGVYFLKVQHKNTWMIKRVMVNN
jgi:hypothetical protein